LFSIIRAKGAHRELVAKGSAAKLQEFRPYRQARREAFGQATARLQQASGVAVATLLKIMMDQNAPQSTRVRAADWVVDRAGKAIEVGDIEANVFGAGAGRRSLEADAYGGIGDVKGRRTSVRGEAPAAGRALGKRSVLRGQSERLIYMHVASASRRPLLSAHSRFVAITALSTRNQSVPGTIGISQRSTRQQQSVDIAQHIDPGSCYRDARSPPTCDC
jgi:hypothetical protein